MATLAADPFEYTATGILGDKRDTMLHNELLLRGKLGQPAVRGYTSYPGETARYGRQNICTDEGAPGALRGWSSGVHFPSRGGAAAGKADRDFMELNRQAVLAGLTTAPEQYQFRATHDIRKSIKTEDNSKKMVRRLPPSMVYGVATRPSTPIHDLLENKYQDKWLEERRRENMGHSNSASAKISPGKVYETRASLLRVHQVPVAPEPLWQMPKFSNRALPHLETFRNESARNKAFEHHKSDCISRRGVIRQGIYASAKF